MSLGKLALTCAEGRWEKAKEMIAHDPRLLFQDKTPAECSPGFYAAYHGNLEMLQYMYDALMKLPGPHDQMLRDAFECQDGHLWTLAHAAAHSGDIRCLEFLITNCWSDPAILNVKNIYGWTPAHTASFRTNYDVFEFILKNSPNMREILEAKNDKGNVPLFYGLPQFCEYFSPEKIRKIGFEKELELLESIDTNGLGSLVLSIVKEDVRLNL